MRLTVASCCAFMMFQLTLLVTLPVLAADSDASKTATVVDIPSRAMDEANEAFWKRDYSRAAELTQVLLQTHTGGKEGKARLLLNLAMCQMQLDDAETAKDKAESALKLADRDSVVYAQ